MAEKLLTTNIPREKDYLYFVNKEKNLTKAKNRDILKVDRKATGNSTTPFCYYSLRGEQSSCSNLRLFLLEER